MSTETPEPIPGAIRNPALEGRARTIAAAIMAATRGVPPRPALKACVNDHVFRRLTARARTHRIRTPDPGYLSRSFLSVVNRNVIEASVVVIGPDMTRAVAIRLERHSRAWIGVDFAVA
ncbi:MAG: Rv3235 family protein [Bifidobacteriaceae bacterium]|jgi:hypothetical protein|nr:Rv3235 family protein [Bifidobacteriaceae bacterium]